MSQPAQLLLLLFTAPQTATSLTLEQWEQLILIARSAKVLAKLSYQVKAQGVFEQLPKYAQRHLNNAQAIADKQNKQIHYEANELSKVVSRFTPDFVFLKGAAYSLANNKAGLGRIYSDIDLIVPKPVLPKVEQGLSILGWQPKETDEYDQNYYRQWAHEIPPMSHASRGTILDLHHNLVPPMSGKAEKLELVIKSTARLNDGILVLKPAAMTLHSAIHLFFNEEFDNGFRDLHDLHGMFSEYGSESYWLEISELAKATGFERELFLALRYCHKMFVTAVPSQIFKDLQSRYAKLTLAYWDFVFGRVLLPHHKLAEVPLQGLAINTALVRGHRLKMPMPLLVKHTLSKAWRGAIKMLFGKTFFLKENKPED